MTETFEDLRTRRYRILIDAGIEPDMAWEVAHHCAVEIIASRAVAGALADNYEASPNVYGNYILDSLAIFD